MTIDQIREKLAEKIKYDNAWGDKLGSDAEPGIYGVIQWEVEISKENIWVDVPTKTFNFSTVSFSFTVRLGGSSAENGIDDSFTRDATGKGTFDFEQNGRGVSIEDMEIEVDLDLYKELT